MMMMKQQMMFAQMQQNYQKYLMTIGNPLMNTFQQMSMAQQNQQMMNDPAFMLMVQQQQ